MKKIKVHLGKRSYPILIGRNLISRTGNLLKPLRLGLKILIVSNRKVGGLFLGKVRASLHRAGYQVVEPYFLRPGNERAKTEGSLFRLWRHMAQQGLERSSTVLALGGGVVGDVAGFAASTYMRGISLIQVPTTLLAQVDAAIGGKTGIDLPSAKNLVGAFHQPRMVIVDVRTLESLSEGNLRELRNAFSEIIKYGVIRDAGLFRLLEKKIDWFFKSVAKKPLGRREMTFLETVVWRSLKVKAQLVEEDEQETQGRRMILNYGHTFAHAFEAASDYRLPHGEAVALGMVSAARVAVTRGMFSALHELRQNWLLEKAGLPTRFDRHRLSFERVIRHMLLDKKKKAGRLRFVLPEAIGRVRVVEYVSVPEVRGVLSDLGGK